MRFVLPVHKRVAALPVPIAFIFGYGDESGISTALGLFYAIATMLISILIGGFIKDFHKAMYFYTAMGLAFMGLMVALQTGF